MQNAQFFLQPNTKSIKMKFTVQILFMALLAIAAAKPAVEDEAPSKLGNLLGKIHSYIPANLDNKLQQTIEKVSKAVDLVKVYVPDEKLVEAADIITRAGALAKDCLPESVNNKLESTKERVKSLAGQMPACVGRVCDQAGGHLNSMENMVNSTKNKAEEKLSKLHGLVDLAKNEIDGRAANLEHLIQRVKSLLPKKSNE